MANDLMNLKQKIAYDYEKIRDLFSSGSSIARFIGLFLVITLLYFVLTGIVLINPIDVNPSLKALNVGLTIIISGLTALIGIITWDRMTLQSSLNDSKKGLIGSAVGLFASACPVCQPIWLLWLGLGPASAFLVEYSTLISLMGIGLLLFAIHSSLSTPLTCEPLLKKEEK